MYSSPIRVFIGSVAKGRWFKSPLLHVKVSLSKIPNPKLSLMSTWHLAWQPPPSVYECVCEWVYLTSVVKHFERSVDWKSAIEVQVHLPFYLSHFSSSFSSLHVAPTFKSICLFLSYYRSDNMRQFMALS